MQQTAAVCTSQAGRRDYSGPDWRLARYLIKLQSKLLRGGWSSRGREELWSRRQSLKLKLTKYPPSAAFWKSSQLKKWKDLNKSKIRPHNCRTGREDKKSASWLMSNISYGWVSRKIRKLDLSFFFSVDNQYHWYRQMFSDAQLKWAHQYNNWNTR